jgi:hypothetical protein
MIKEFAFGLSNRCHFQEASKAGEWMGLDRDTFVSLYDYDNNVINYVQQKGKLAGYDGPIYMPDEFILDVDGTNPLNAREKLLGLMIVLDDLNMAYNMYFSGTGFHVGIHSSAFRWQPCDDLHIKVKKELTSKGIFEYADPAVTDKTRIIRLVNTRNSKSNLWKVQIDPVLNILDKDDKEFVQEIEQFASKPQKVINDDIECNVVFDVLGAVQTTSRSDLNEEPVPSQGRQPDPMNYPCIQRMLYGSVIGSRHLVALRLAAWMRWLYPEETVRLLMNDWRERVDNPDKPFKQKEMDAIVDNCYEGHDGSGYRYGCHDIVMDKHCQNTCRLFKSKKSQNTMNAEMMEKEMIDFYKRDLNPINFSEIYTKCDFPIYPGEVVILQAPPASMKTMLLQNLMVAFKKPTYFIEMEMSPRQIWSRFAMIETGMSEEQLAAHYKQYNNGISQSFNWLTVDYGSLYTHELEKRIATLPVKPELVVVDHMGLFRSKQRDHNMKVEEASQALMELAVKHQVIVFTVSEISKQAMVEGMNIASSRGSFRVAYNANKILSLKPFKDEQGNIKMLQLVSDKNRERETLNIKLGIDNVRMVPYEE